MSSDLSQYMRNKDPNIQKISVSHIDYSADYAYLWSKTKEYCCLQFDQTPNDEQIRLFKKKLKHLNAITNNISELNENHLDFIQGASDWTYIFALMIYKYPVGDQIYQDFRNNITIMVNAIDYLMNNQKVNPLIMFSMIGSKQYGIVIDTLKKIDLLQNDDQIHQYMKNIEVSVLQDSYFYKLFIKSKKKGLIQKLETINKQADYLLFKRAEGIMDRNELVDILFEELHQINLPVDVKSKILMQFKQEL